MKYSDFAELTQSVKAMSEEEKKTLTVWEDEGIVRVQMPDPDEPDEDIIIFSAEAVNFVHAFFILLGVDVDDNISIK